MRAFSYSRGEQQQISVTHHETLGIMLSGLSTYEEIPRVCVATADLMTEIVIIGKVTIMEEYRNVTAKEKPE